MESENPGSRIPKHLYPFDSHWLEIQHGEPRIRLHYLDEGPRDAPPVLMLHGNPTWSFYYRELVLQLRGRYRCIVPDHIGCGLSDKPGDEHYSYRLVSRVRDISHLINHLVTTRSLELPLTLVVHDWGGMIGFAWAVQNSEALSRLVIMNTAAFPLPGEKPLPLALKFVRESALGALLVLRFNAFAVIAARVGFKKPVSKEVRKAYTTPYDSPAHRIATLRFVQDIPLSPQDAGFDILTNTSKHLQWFSDLPCLIAWGEKDFVFDASILNKWLEIYPDAELYRFAGCGHYVLEDGGKAIVDAIVNFIEIKDESNHGHASE
jgi:haloalkane dehalogenase